MKFEVKKSTIHGKGVFCTQSLKKGELIFISRGIRTLNKSTSIQDAWLTHRHSISIDEKIIHIPIPGDTLRYINHSCTSNCYVDHGNKFYALRDIRPGEEITIDYSFVDADIFWRMHNCKCRTLNCRQTITSSILLPRPFFKKNLTYIPKKIRKFNAKFYGVPLRIYEC